MAYKTWQIYEMSYIGKNFNNKRTFENMTLFNITPHLCDKNVNRLFQQKPLHFLIETDF